MRKNKLLKKVVAMVSAVAMAVTMVPALSSTEVAQAAATTDESGSTLWIYERDGISGIPSEWGLQSGTNDRGTFTVTDTTSTLSDSTSTGSYVKDVLYNGSSLVNTLLNRTGFEIKDSTIKTVHDSSAQSKRIAFVPKISGTFKFYIARNSGVTDVKSNSFRTYTLNANNSRVQGLSIDSNGFMRNTENIEAITYSADANEYFEIYSNNSGNLIMAIEFIPTVNKPMIQYNSDKSACRIVYPVSNSVIGKESIGLKVNSNNASETYTGTKVYSSVKAGDITYSAPADSVLVVVEITDMPATYGSFTVQPTVIDNGDITAIGTEYTVPAKN